MMYKVKDEINSNNEDVEKNHVFSNEVEWTVVLVRRWVVTVKAKEWVLLLFKRTKLNKDGVLYRHDP
jgi:hypothetical protein